MVIQATTTWRHTKTRGGERSRDKDKSFAHKTTFRQSSTTRDAQHTSEASMGLPPCGEHRKGQWAFRPVVTVYCSVKRQHSVPTRAPGEAQARHVTAGKAMVQCCRPCQRSRKPQETEDAPRPDRSSARPLSVLN